MNQSERLFEAYQRVRAQSLALVEPLGSEDFCAQPIEDVSPPKWHLGHTSWFFETFLLKPQLPDYQPCDERYGYLFNSYYESAGPRVLRSQRGRLTRPDINEVREYRRRVDAGMHSLLERGDLNQEALKLIELGLHHEQQHQELLVTDIKYILGCNPLLPAYHAELANQILKDSEPESWLELAEGVYEIGHTGSEFCFDNEQGRHKVYLNGGRIASRPVSNREYLEFISDGGYERFEHWLSDGWSWVQTDQVKAPLYWHQIDGEWCHYTLAGLQKLDLDAPVTHVSYYEADAFAAWRGLRLPSEQEWEVAVRQYQPEIPETACFMDVAVFQPQSEPSLGFWGNVWEWTQSAYLPYPGFSKRPGAVGEYNGKFMCNQMVLRGGSCATPADHIRSSYRNFFQPDKRWQFTGIRLASSD